MSRFITCIIVSMSLLLAPATQARQSLDPRDPSIWQEKPAPEQLPRYVPCELESGPDCPTLDSEKSVIQLERERREKRAIYSWSMDKH